MNKKLDNKSKKVLGIELLIIELIIVKCFLGGFSANDVMHSVLPQAIFFVLISIIMMIVPFVLYTLNKGRLSYKYGLTISIYNSLYIYVVAMVHPIITLILGKDASFKTFNFLISSWGLMLLYTITGILFITINMLLFVKSKDEEVKTNKRKK